MRNASAEGETGNFWNGTERSFNTGAIAYEPRYNEYAQPPRTVLENGVLLNEFSNGRTLPLTDQVVVDDDRIRIGVLNGSLSLDRIDSASVDLQPVSTQTRTVAVSGTDGENVTIELPTRLDQDDWEELIADELEEGRVHNVTVDDENGTVTIEMENLSGDDTYDLQLWKVGVGTGVEPTEAGYLTNVGDTNRTVQQGETVSLVVEARDKFNGPKGGVTPTASTISGTATITGPSDESGQLTVEYTAPPSVGTDTVRVEQDFDRSGTNESDERVSFTINVGSSGTGTGDSTPPVFDDEPTASPDSVPEGDKFNLTATLNDTNRGGTDIISVKWSDNQGNSGELLANDGEFDQPVEAVGDSVLTDNWSKGDHAITVTGTDSNGNARSGTTTVTIGDSLSGNEVAFNDTNDNGVYDSGTDTAYTTENIKDFDNSSADLIIEKDIDPDSIDLKAESVTVRGGVTVSTGDGGGITMRAVGGSIDVGGATLNAGDNDAKPIELIINNNNEADIDVRDTVLISNDSIEATPGANGTLFVNDNGGNRSDGGTYIENKTGSASTLTLQQGTVQGSPERGEVSDNT
ncbi:hypothetical protein BRC62_05475 [Halobacteriales archaeon QH_10_67_13]|nr:MAG: hypothetical protein BRC62_05475 [Halobacteriales archaeon QH_10_67_13]